MGTDNAAQPLRRLACVPIAYLAVALLVQGCVSQPHMPASVSARDIERLGTSPSLDDVVRLVGGLPLMEIPYIEHPASEGGLYVFLFLPTNEVTEPAKYHSDTLALVAVVQTDSHDAFMRSEGRYVFPQTAVGKKFTGLALQPTTQPICQP